MKRDWYKLTLYSISLAAMSVAKYRWLTGQAVDVILTVGQVATGLRMLESYALKPTKEVDDADSNPNRG